MRLRFVLALAFVVAPLWAFSQTHTITNGGFEQLDANYFPRDWSPVGETVAVSTEAHSGRYALRIRRPRQTPMPPETGLNRGWTPGQIGAMLDVRKGIVSVWYRVLSAEPDAVMAIVVIPMGENRVEDTGEMRAQRTIPNEVAGDGQWHEIRFAYDYSGAPKVKWVHVGVRIVGGAADLLVDDFELSESAMSILQVEKVHVYPDPSAPDRTADLQACVANAGTAATGQISVTLELPRGLTGEGPTSAGPLPPNGAATLKWRLRGRLAPGIIRVHADDGQSREMATTRLAPRAELLSALATPALASPGSPVVITATVWNRGTAIAEGYSVSLADTAGSLRKSLSVAPVLPGRRATVQFRVTATGRPGQQLRYRCALAGVPAGQPEQAWPVSVEVTDAFSSRTSVSIGPLTLRTGSDRTVGQIPRVQGKTAAPVGVLPHLGRVTFMLPSGGTQTITARYTLPRTVRGSATLLSTQTDRSGGRWQFRTGLKPLAPDAIRVQVSVRCSAPRKLISFEGPMLLVGERAGGAQRTEAIFPGLEWLVADEVSSGDLDIITSHQDRPRFAPHPNKVTIPAMVVQTRVGTTGLYWNSYGRWDGLHDRPQPVFASPDRINGRAGHLMGLMAPSAAHGWPENGVVRANSYTFALSAGRTLTLSGVIAVMPSEGTAVRPGALGGVARWFSFFKPRKPAPAPQGSDPAQIAWSMNAYMETLWDKDGGGWLPYLNGPAIWRKPGFDASFAYDLMEATRILPSHPTASRWAERLAVAREHTVPSTQDEFGFAEGDPLSTLRGQAWSMASLMGQQAPDGSYTFDADRRDEGVFKGYDFHELGKPGEVEVGLIARNAYVLLRAARLTGDRLVWEAGLRSLRRMRAFRVPRAAQVWEVPVHTPDILAAADAVEAYLEAYRIDGDRQWLDDARRWAMAGMPFVYVWNAPGKLWMRWGSIPVFGASQMRGSWFGNIVQWNGLRYAGALLKLYPYDAKMRLAGLSWRDVAMGITRCAMYQQSTKKEIYTLWPDSYHTITNTRAAWDFAPRQILKNVFAYMGRSEEPETVRVSGDGGSVARISSLGTITQTSWKGDNLAFSVRHPSRMRGTVLVAGVSRPSAVQIGSARVPEVAALRRDEACWRYDPSLKAVAVRIPSDAPSRVQMAGVTPATLSLIPIPETRLWFDFDGDDGGWSPEHDVAGFGVREGALTGVTSGGDPYVVRSNCKFDGDAVKTVVIRIRAESGSDPAAHGQFYWTTSDEASFAEEKVILFDYPRDGQWHEVQLAVGDHERWHRKTITAIRIDPLNGGAGVEFAIDWVHGQ